MTKLMCTLSLTAILAAQASAPASPVEPIGAIVQAFKTHPIVAIGNVEFRGNEQSHKFQLALIRDPRIAAVVNDIVVEFGSARYQEVIDQFIRGEDVPPESLRRVWQNTTQIEFEWDLPIYEDFFRAVRAVNQSLPRERRLRVLLGDPPIDWDKVHTRDDLHKEMGDRDAHAVEVLRREVLAKGRRALVIYGGQHLIRRNTIPEAPDVWSRGIVARLEKDKIANVFTILPETRKDLRAVQPSIESWPIPSLAILRGTTLGAAIWDQNPQRRSVRNEDQMDAIVYLGPPSSMTMAKLSPALCSDAGYMQMRLGRLNLISPPSGAPSAPADQLKDYCAHPGGYTEIQDREPAITELIRTIIRDAAQGKVKPESFASESRERIVSFLQRDGPRYLGPAGELQSLALLEDTDSAGKHRRRYRASFASGLRMIWKVEFSATREIVSLEPRPE